MLGCTAGARLVVRDPAPTVETTDCLLISSAEIHMSGNPCRFKRSMQHHLIS